MVSLVRFGDEVGGSLVLLWILGRHFQLLPTIKGAQEKWIVLGVCIVAWGSDGPPWSQSVDMGSLVREGDGMGGWVF